MLNFWYFHFHCLFILNWHSIFFFFTASYVFSCHIRHFNWKHFFFLLLVCLLKFFFNSRMHIVKLNDVILVGITETSNQKTARIKIIKGVAMTKFMKQKKKWNCSCILRNVNLSRRWKWMEIESTRLDSRKSHEIVDFPILVNPIFISFHFFFRLSSLLSMANGINWKLAVDFTSACTHFKCFQSEKC